MAFFSLIDYYCASVVGVEELDFANLNVVYEEFWHNTCGAIEYYVIESEVHPATEGHDARMLMYAINIRDLLEDDCPVNPSFLTYHSRVDSQLWWRALGLLDLCMGHAHMEWNNIHF
jgi:hypothetical protein